MDPASERQSDSFDRPGGLNVTVDLIDPRSSEEAGIYAMSSSPKEHPKIYSLEDIEKVVSAPGFRTKLIDGIRDGFVAFEKGEFFAAPIQTLGLPPFPFVEVDGYAAQTCVKSGYFRGHDHYVIKVASGGHPMPSKWPAAAYRIFHSLKI